MLEVKDSVRRAEHGLFLSDPRMRREEVLKQFLVFRLVLLQVLDLVFNRGSVFLVLLQLAFLLFLLLLKAVKALLSVLLFSLKLFIVLLFLFKVSHKVVQHDFDSFHLSFVLLAFFLLFFKSLLLFFLRCR